MGNTKGRHLYCVGQLVLLFWVVKSCCFFFIPPFCPKTVLTIPFVSPHNKNAYLSYFLGGTKGPLLLCRGRKGALLLLKPHCYCLEGTGVGNIIMWKNSRGGMFLHVENAIKVL